MFRSRSHTSESKKSAAQESLRSFSQHSRRSSTIGHDTDESVMLLASTADEDELESMISESTGSTKSTCTFFPVFHIFAIFWEHLFLSAFANEFLAYFLYKWFENKLKIRSLCGAWCWTSLHLFVRTTWKHCADEAPLSISRVLFWCCSFFTFFAVFSLSRFFFFFVFFRLFLCKSD